MGFSEIVETVNTVKTTFDSAKNADPYSSAKEIEYAQKSIASKAKKALCVYDVLITSGLSDYESYYSIVKYLEAQYSAFTIIAAGLNQIVEKGQSMMDVISDITTESYNNDYKDELKKLNKRFGKPVYDGFGNEVEVTVENFYKEQIVLESLGESVIPTSNIKQMISSFSSEFKSLIVDLKNFDPSYDPNNSPLSSQAPKHFRKMENMVKCIKIAIVIFREIVDFAERADVDEILLDSIYDDKSNIDKLIDDISDVNYSDAFREQRLKSELSGKAPKINKSNLLGNTKMNSRDVNAVKAHVKKISEMTPITIDLTISREGIGALSFTLMIKANPMLLTEANMKNLFEYLTEQNRSKRYQWVMVTSGQKKFFRDFVLQLDKAERDRDLYASLGEHPYFRVLMERKQKSLFRGILKSFGNKVSPVPPTAALVCTLDEITSGLKTLRSNFLKNDKRVIKLVEKAFLLTLGVVDTDTGMVRFYFNGLDKPINYNIRELNKKSGKNDEKLIGIIDKMTNKI